MEAGLSTQEDVSLAELGRVHGVHMPGGYPQQQQGMPPQQHPQQGAQQQRQHQLQQQQLFNLKMLETSMENLPEQMDYEKYTHARRPLFFFLLFYYYFKYFCSFFLLILLYSFLKIDLVLFFPIFFYFSLLFFI